MKIDDLKEEYIYGMRALGAIDGTYHSNTLEGYKHWFNKGIKFWECDVAVSEDNKYVMIGHFLNEETMKRMEIDNLPEKLTYDWYLSRKLFPKSTKGLTPLGIEDMISLAKKNTETIYMLDLYPFSIKNSYFSTLSFLRYFDNALKGDSILYERFSIETYNKEMVKAVNDFGKVNYIQLSISGFMKNEGIENINEVIDYAIQNNVNMISYEWRYARKHLDHLRELKKQDFVFVSRSVTNLFNNKKKKALGVNIALLDYYVTNPLDIFQIGRLFFSRMEQKHG